MSKQDKNTPEDNLDAPSILPIPEGEKNPAANKIPLGNLGMQETPEARDPSEVPPAVGKEIPAIPAQDEQALSEKEVMEGVDRADDDQRREGTLPSTQPPPSERE